MQLLIRILQMCTGTRTEIGRREKITNLARIMRKPPDIASTTFSLSQQFDVPGC